MRRSRQKRGSVLGKIMTTTIITAIGATAWYVYSSPDFDRNSPKIETKDEIYWNRVDPLKIKVSDNIALKHYSIYLNDGATDTLIGEGDFPANTKSEVLKIKYPKSEKFKKIIDNLKLKIKITDASMWNMFQGNIDQKDINIKVDYKRPNVNILANSRMINQGGSALVVFQANDENLKELYVEANGNKFIAQPYKKKGYYAVLIAWPFSDDTFSAKIYATDKANNKRITKIPFYHKNPKYKTSQIKASDNFIDGKITDLASSSPEYASISDKLEKLKSINETMRLDNEKTIHKYSSKVSNKMLKSWEIKRFYPLRNGQKVASFGDHRYYYYKKKNNVVSESFHVGYDLASTSMADIKASNAGTVVYAEDNGIYGNMPMIDHGLGLYTLYGHCSQLLVNVGDEVKAGQVIAKTGKSGLALGDHLHFGILVQGIEVRPIEWFDKKWIKKFIDNIFKKADKIIGEN